MYITELISTSLAQSLEESLSQKLFERIYWWSIQRWNTVVILDCALTKENPLWRRTDEELANLRLFGLTLEELESEIAQYLQKSWWQQWLSSLFSTIDKKIELWLYYQKCLAFRETRNSVIRSIEIDLVINNSLFSRKIKGLLVDWIKQYLLHFETYLENHCRSGPPNKECFRSTLKSEALKWKKIFLKKLFKLLALLPQYQRALSEECAKQSYKDIEKILQNYLAMWHHNVSNAYFRRFRQPAQEQHLVEYAGAVVSSSTPVTGHSSEETRVLNPQIPCSLSYIATWSKLKRQIIQTIFAEDIENRETKIQSVLEDSLQDIANIIKPQIKYYQERIGKIEHIPLKDKESLLQLTLSLEKALKKIYLQATLLFHPDHYYDLFKQLKTDALAHYWNHIFIRFNKQSYDTLTQLQIGKNKLELLLLPPGKSVAELIKEHQRQLDEQYAKWRAEVKMEMEKFKATLEEIKTEIMAEMKIKIKTRVSKELTKNKDQIVTLLKYSSTNLKPEASNSHQTNQMNAFKPS